jgi:hypothetical protein
MNTHARCLLIYSRRKMPRKEHKPSWRKESHIFREDKVYGLRDFRKTSRALARLGSYEKAELPGLALRVWGQAAIMIC